MDDPPPYSDSEKENDPQGSSSNAECAAPTGPSGAASTGDASTSDASTSDASTSDASTSDGDCSVSDVSVSGDTASSAGSTPASPQGSSQGSGASGDDVTLVLRLPVARGSKKRRKSDPGPAAHVKGYTFDEMEFYESLSPRERQAIDACEEGLAQSSGGGPVPLRFQVLRSGMPRSVKLEVLGHIRGGDGAMCRKRKEWVSELLKLPFAGSSEAPSPASLSEAERAMDTLVYGNQPAKDHVLRLLAQWVANPASRSGTVLGICGPPGTGKTLLMKEALGRALNRPFAMISLGGASDSHFLLGHGFTYEGAQPGRIVRALQDTRTTDCVLYFDELDKVAEGKKASDVESALLHITDPVQNARFEDRYFAGIPIDLSRVVMVFSFNDINRVSPILRDRLTVVHTHEFSQPEKLIIARDYMLPGVLERYRLQVDRALLVERVADDHEGGVRQLKRDLEEVVSIINLKLIRGGVVAGPRDGTPFLEEALRERRAAAPVPPMPEALASMYI